MKGRAKYQQSSDAIVLVAVATTLTLCAVPCTDAFHAPISLPFDHVSNRRRAHRHAVTQLSSSNSEDASRVTFFVSPSSLDHLAMFDQEEEIDGRRIPPACFDKALLADDDENHQSDGKEGKKTQIDFGSPTKPKPSASETVLTKYFVILAKLPAFGVAILAALVVGYGSTKLLEDVFHLDLITAAPLLYYLGFSVGWQAMGGDMDDEIEDASDAQNDFGAGDMDDGASRAERMSDEEWDMLQYVLDRPVRLRTILNTLQSQNANIVTAPLFSERDVSKALQYVTSAHTKKYVDNLRAKCSALSQGSNQIQRLSNGSTRTYIDSNSYEAAICSVQDWIDAVDHTMTTDSPAFALTRPPSHHACPTRGMGGCLLNGCAVAAYYALKTYPNVKHVAILDIDAHHGNGIAACVQDRPPIRYCSIHEYSKSEVEMGGRTEPRADNPRGPGVGDVGPRMNLNNVVLKSGTGWDGGYEDAFLNRAIPFLKERNPDLLLVACGLDALEVDGTSSLMLQPSDFQRIGSILKKEFANKVVFGLEGGYSWENGDIMGRSIMEITSAW